MDPAPPHPTDPAETGPDTPATARRTPRQRWLPVVLAGVAVLVFATALGVSFLGGSSGDSADIERLDQNAAAPPELSSTQDDPVGRKLGALTYTTFDGATKDLRPDGRPLLLNFWSSTCAPCIKEMPALNAAWEANRGRIDVLGLDYFEAPELGQAMADRTGARYPLGRDAKGILLRRLGGVGLPYTVLVGTDGTILATHSGELDQAGFQRLIDTAAGR